MTKRKTLKNSEAEDSEEIKIGSVKISSEEISLVATQYDLNFRTVKFKKDVPVNYTRIAFDELVKSTPNIEYFIELGALKIV